MEILLCTQVEENCPSCGTPLFKLKGKSRYKEYEIAHIYPLNPEPHEVILLQHEERLSLNPNHEDNLIPLCFSCHNIFDNPKTVDGYRDLLGKKRTLIKKSSQISIFKQYQLEEEIAEIIRSLVDDDVDFGAPAGFDAKNINTKLNGVINSLTKIKIKSDISSFYLFIRDRFAEMERISPSKAVLIAQQVRMFYVKQSTLSLTQQEIYQNTVAWITSKFKPSSQQAAEAIAAFYIQNCELF
ncbi:ABC-three component system protein [Massilia pseudoviolaceinigra]|uniref:ABC-three component system protein n=1 Tax=Massilia pseudoviolaceinigra TaxID=3057165 RepID=UPI0027966B9D|nr:ABC-three component system protein [Massilia sp. CCM 9206]MDQ1925162.1 hypothetical protein [Massilia sp. CCM 9206]